MAGIEQNVQAREKEFRFLTLAHHINPTTLKTAYMSLHKRAAPGVDKETWHSYYDNHEQNLVNLHEQLRTMKYRATSVRRVWIPKAGNPKGRPLGIAILEDKIVQTALKTLLEPIYEEEFYDFSYGYRKGKGCHQAIKHLYSDITKQKLKWVIDADISNYFNDISHHQLREFLKLRVADGNVHRLIGKWLKAGIPEEGQLTFPKAGTSQGASISPLLANIYLHYVLDKWFVEEAMPRLQGKATLIRVADDFVIACEHESDARKLMEVLPKRLGRYGLTLNEEKTQLIDFKRPEQKDRKGRENFTFLGFLFYWGRSRKGNFVVKLKTDKRRKQRAFQAINEWCQRNRHRPIQEQVRILNQKLQGHYNYYGVTFNGHSLSSVYFEVRRAWFKWLGRRGGKTPLTWERFEEIEKIYSLKLPRITVSLFA